MLRLLTADLASLANLFRRREGRRLLFSAALSLGFLGFVADLFGQIVARSPQLGQMAGGAGGMDSLLGSMLVPALLLSLWFGFGGGPRQLFELRQIEMLLQAPLAAPKVLLATWLRFGAIVSLWCTVLCAPMAGRVGEGLGVRVPWTVAAIACACLALPAVAVLLSLQVVLMRFFAGRFTRLLLTSLGAAGSIAFSLLLIAGVLAQEETVRMILAAARGQAVWPFLLDAPARLWAELVRDGVPRVATIGRVLAVLGGAAGLVAAVGVLYRTAYENARGSVEPVLRWGRGRRWPSAATAVVFRKEIAQMLHQPGQLVGLLFSAVLVVVLAGGRFLGGAFAQDMPATEGERHVFVMLALWLFAQLTVAPGCLMRIVISEGTQWVVFVGAPVRSLSLLLGKLGAVALLMTWPAVVAGAVGVVRYGVGPTTLLAFVAVVPACILWTAAATTMVGTIPTLMRPRPERNNLLALVGVVLLMVVLQVTAVPGLLAWSLCARRGIGDGPLAGMSDDAAHAALIGGAWAAATLATCLALAVATFQVRRLRAPER